MRHDMYKVIVERPRRAGYYAKARKGRYYETVASSIRNAVEAYYWEEEADEPPCKESIRPKGRGAGRKELNENLMPLWRFLEGKVGTLWNDVYSEIRTNLSPNSAVQMHVVQHLKTAVETSAFLIDEKPYRAPMYGGNLISLEEAAFYRHQFYVHPTTGLLCVSPCKSRRPIKVEQNNIIKMSEKHQFRFIDGIWYWIRLESIPQNLGILSRYSYWRGVRGLEFDHVGDVLFPQGLSEWRRKAEYSRENIRAVEKRQCGRRELKLIQKLLSK